MSCKSAQWERNCSVAERQNDRRTERHDKTSFAKLRKANIGIFYDLYESTLTARNECLIADENMQ